MFPTDYVSTATGETIVTLYHRETKSDGYYRDGNKLLDDSLDVRVKAIRIAHMIDTYGYTTSFLAVASYAHATFEGSFIENLYPHNTSGTGDLRYRPIPITGLFAGYQINRGGESLMDGIPQNDETNNERFMAGGAVFAYGTQIVLRYARDVKIDTGFRTGNEVTLRLQWRF